MGFDPCTFSNAAISVFLYHIHNYSTFWVSDGQVVLHVLLIIKLKYQSLYIYSWQEDTSPKVSEVLENVLYTESTIYYRKRKQALSTKRSEKKTFYHIKYLSRAVFVLRGKYPGK